MDRNELVNIIKTTVETTIKSLVDKGILGKGANASGKASGKSANANAAPDKIEKTAYQKTEQLLFNYNNFKKIIKDKQLEIEEIRKYGVPKRGGAVVQYGGGSGTVQGLVLDEERVEAAVRNVEKSMCTTVQAIELIDKGMSALSKDPYYKVLEMRYFDGRTQEDIAVDFNCTQQNIAYHKNRLVKELAIKLFPDKVAEEMLS